MAKACGQQIRRAQSKLENLSGAGPQLENGTSSPDRQVKMSNDRSTIRASLHIAKQ